MSADRDWKLLLPASVRRFPPDLAAVIWVTVLTMLVVSVPVVRESVFRVLIGLAFVLFLPGYALVSALFPEDYSEDESEDENDGGRAGIDWVERLALGFGMSVAVVPLIGMVVSVTPWGLGFTPILLSLACFTVGCSLVAAARRRRLPEEERFTVPYREWIVTARETLYAARGNRTALLNVALALSMVLARGTFAYAIAAPQNAERYTQAYLLTEGNDGELVAANYPDEFVRGESESLVLGLENNEQETIEYTIVIQQQRLDGEGANATVAERQELDRFRMTLSHGETWHHEHRLTPTMIGEDIRLTYLVYKDDVPGDPTRENADETLHIWITVDYADEDEVADE